MDIRIRRGTKQNSFQKYAMIKVVGDPNFNAFKLNGNRVPFGEFNIDLESDRKEVLECTPSFFSNHLKEGEVDYDTATLVSESAVKIEDVIRALGMRIASHHSDFVHTNKVKEECELKWQTGEDEIINIDFYKR